MKAPVLITYGSIEWKSVPDPQPAPNQALIQVNYASICGTDLHVFSGAFKERTSLPLILGHEFAGEIVEVSESVDSALVGDRVAVDPIIWCGECPACRAQHYPACESLKLLGIDLDGGFAQFVAADADKLYHLPDTISDRHAALIEVFSIGFHVTNRAAVSAGNSVAVFGAGRAGQCIIQAARTKTDAPIYAIDVLDSRLKLAEQINENVTGINPTRDDPREVIREMTNGYSVDIAIESVGHARQIPDVPNPVQCAIDSIRSGGTVCMIGLGDQTSEILTKRLVLKEANLLTSRVTQGEFQETIDAMEQGIIFPEPLISAEYPGSETHKAITSLEKTPEQYLKILLRVKEN